MPRTGPILCLAVLGWLLMAASARAAVTFTYSATFATTPDSFTSSVTTGTCPPLTVTCPTAQADWQPSGGAGGSADGHLRSRLTTGVAVPSDVQVLWRSGAFSVGPMDSSAGSLKVRTDAGSLLDDPATSLRLQGRLVDVAGGSTLVSDVALLNASGYSTIAVPLPAGALRTGHTYRFEATVSLQAPAQPTETTVTVSLDDMSLTLVQLQAPTGLTASASVASGVTVAGTVDPHNVPTTARIEYGATAAYGSTSPGTPLSGSGAKGYSIPLAGLVPGQTYHYRAVAASADGTVTTADKTFIIPFIPSNAAPSVAGALNGRVRTATYDVVAGTTAVRVELIDAGGAVVGIVADADLDGSANLTLPDADGTYGVRVVRDGAGGGSSSSATVSVLLDRVAPSVASLGLAVAPAISSLSTRSVTFSRPSDAASAEVQVLDASGAAVGPPVIAAGGGAAVELGAGDGAYRVRLTLRDAAGNAAVATSGTLTLDTAAPDAGSSPLVTGAQSGRARDVTFARASDAVAVTVEVLAGGALVTSTPVSAGEQATLTLPDADGLFAVRVRQTDLSGNTARTPSTTVALDRVAPDSGPAPAITGSDTDRTRSVGFTRAADAATATLELLEADGTLLDAVSVPTAAIGDVTLPDRDGTYLLRVRQTDAAGNAAMSPTSVVVLFRPPAAPTPTPTASPTPEPTPDPTATSTPEPTPTPTPVAPVTDTPRITDPGRFGPLLEDCYSATNGIALTDVRATKTSVRVAGLHAFRPGTAISIIDSHGRIAARTVAGRDGRFAAIAPLPKKSERRWIRYRATAGTAVSASLKLVRATTLLRMRVHGDSVTVSGKIARGVAARVRSIVVRGGRGPEACHGNGEVLTLSSSARINRRTGRFTAKAHLPARTGRVVVRVRISGTMTSASLYMIR